MSSEWVNGLQTTFGANVIAQDAEPDRKRVDSPMGERDQAWQRELAQAQAAGFSGWFDSSLPSPIASRTAMTNESAGQLGTAVSEQPIAATAVLSSSKMSQAPQQSTTQSLFESVPASERGVADAAPLWSAYGSADAVALWAGWGATQPGIGASSSRSVVADHNASTIDQQEAPQAPTQPTAQLNAMIAAQLAHPVETVDEPELAQGPASRDAAVASDSAHVAQDDSARASSEPVRLYAEWSAEGVRIWLGADADQLADIEPLAKQLRAQLHAHGIDLRSLVCNGAEVALGSAAADPTSTADKTLPAQATPGQKNFSYFPVSLQVNSEDI